MKAPISRSPEKVSTRILDAAETEFLEFGFEAASTNRIVQSFGGSKATLFRYFPTKEQLLEAVIRRIAGRWQGRIDHAAIHTDDPHDWLIAFTTQVLDWILSADALGVGRLGIAEGHKFPDLRQIFAQTAAEPLQRLLSGRLREWKEAGALDCTEPEKDADLFMDMAVSGLVSRTLYRVAEYGTAERLAQARAATALFLNGRRPRPDSPGQPASRM